MLWGRADDVKHVSDEVKRDVGVEQVRHGVVLNLFKKAAPVPKTAHTIAKKTVKSEN